MTGPQRRPTISEHVTRIALLSALAAGILLAISARTEIVFADGLRYIHQAQRIAAGSWSEGILRSIDHPLYPLSIALAHHAIGGSSPESWQSAAQASSVLSGILLVLPLYLIGIEVFGGTAAWLGCMLFFLAPLNSRVLADSLSEGLFLLFFAWGLWCALRFLRRGAFGWLPLMLCFSALAYWTRPEGLLLPFAMILTLGVMPFLPSTRLHWPRWTAAVLVLVVVPLLIVGPLLAVKGGIGTKPSVSRILGTGPHSPSGAVERSRPLDPNQSVAKTYLVAAKAVFGAVRDAVSLPLLPLALVGMATWRPARERSRIALFITLMIGAALLALVRLHATGGYCTPRHALILTLVLIPAAARGIDWLMHSIRLPANWFGDREGSLRFGPATWLLLIIGFAAWSAPRLLAPLNHASVGYRQAADWLEQNSRTDEKTVDVTGWSLFYADRPGYTFANLILASGDPASRFVVVRRSHLAGPWDYCRILKGLVTGLQPVAVFPSKPNGAVAVVEVYDRFERSGTDVASHAEALVQ